MITKYIDIILFMTGIFTASVILYYFAPVHLLEKVNQLKITDERSLFFIRHWAIVISLYGVLLIYASFVDAVRLPLIITVGLGKLALVLMLIKNYKRIGRGFIPIIIFDSFCVLAYSGYLIEVLFKTYL